MKAEYRRDLKNNYLVIEATEKEEDEDYCIHMVEQNKIPGLLPFHRSRRDGKLFLNYEITGRQAVASLFEKRYLGYADILFLLSGISEHLDTLCRYLLSPEKLIFDPQYVFTEPERRGIWLCYAPGVEQETPVALLAEFILKRLDHEDGSAVALGYRFYAKTQEENFSLQAALRELLFECRAGIQDPSDADAEMPESGDAWGSGRDVLPGDPASFSGGTRNTKNKGNALSQGMPYIEEEGKTVFPSSVRHEIGKTGIPSSDARYGTGRAGDLSSNARQEVGKAGGLASDAQYGTRQPDGLPSGVGGGTRTSGASSSNARYGTGRSGGSSLNARQEAWNAGSPASDPRYRSAESGRSGSGQRGWQGQSDQDPIWKEYEVIHKSRSDRGDAASKELRPKGRDAASKKLRSKGGESGSPRLAERIFRVVHPAVLLSALFLIAASEAAFYFGYLEVTEAGGVFFLILSVELLANSYWRSAKERKEQERYEGWDDEEDEDGEYLRLQAEMYETSRAGRMEKEQIGETRCLTESEEAGQMRLIYVPAYGSFKEGTASFPDIVVGGDAVTVGKLPGACEIVLQAQTVSRLHARLERRQEKYFLQDLNSRNGTFLNGERLDPQEIREFSGGDRIAFADIQYRAVCL